MTVTVTVYELSVKMAEEEELVIQFSESDARHIVQAKISSYLAKELIKALSKRLCPKCEHFKHTKPCKERVPDHTDYVDCGCTT